MDNQKQKTGIIGGSFDPIHLGHTEIALAALDEFGFDSLLFIPSCIPPHKQANHASPEDRIKMVGLAIADIPNASVSDIEIARGGLTYTIDTIKSLNSLYPERGFSFIIGSDTLLQLDTWKGIKAICEMTDFVCVTRPGHASGIEEKAQILKKNYNASIKIVYHAGLDISSSEIRLLIKDNIPVDKFVCPAVMKYITAHELYT